MDSRVRAAIKLGWKNPRSTDSLSKVNACTGCVVRTLIPKLAEGIFDVIATFNKTNEYVLYYHSGRKTIR
jgi:hypothetical protein